MRPEAAPTIRRIVVAMDASAHSQAALEAAITMATRFGAQLQGLYVEDVNVLRIAGLPNAHEFGIHSARWRRVTAGDVERQLRVRSREVQEEFQRLTARAAVLGTFHVARGTVDIEIRAAAAQADMLVVGRVGWSQLRRRQVGSTARALCGAAETDVIAVLHAGTRIDPPLMVVWHGGDPSERTLALAAGLATGTTPIELLAVAQDDVQLETAELALDKALAELGLANRRHRMVLPSSADLVQAARVFGAGTLLAPGCLACLEEDGLVSLLSQVDVPILLVR